MSNRNSKRNPVRSLLRNFLPLRLKIIGLIKSNFADFAELASSAIAGSIRLQKALPIDMRTKRECKA
jgi:hypothetical protein